MSLNVDFLRSGRAFVVDNNTEQPSHPHASANERLNKFYTHTLSAVESAVEAEKISPDFKVVRNAPSSVLNLDFLRSGGEFKSEPALKEEPKDLKVLSASARLNTFYNQTIAAVEQAVENQLVSRDFKIAQSAPTTILNMNFLKSGGEFVSQVEAPVATAPSTPKTARQRLDDYYRSTLSAVESATASVSRDFKVAQETPKSVVNLDFLRSGGEFTNNDALRASLAPPSDRPRSHSMNERLNKFYDQTLSAVEAALHTEQVSRDFKFAHTAPPSLVNLDFLCSGAEFSPSQPIAAPVLASQPPRSPQLSTSRLESFHARTAAAIAAAAKAGAIVHV